MTVSACQRIAESYIQYCDVIKPLIARIEAQSEKIPLPLFNEIRAFNDHIARCYYNNPTDEYINEQIDKASRHIVRMTLDCFKCLIVIMYQKIEQFEKRTRNIDLTVIDNGLFYPEYSRMKVEAATAVNNAKLQELININDALIQFERACNVYTDIVNSIDRVNETVKWAKVRFYSRKTITILAWVASIVVSAIISALFTCEIFSSFFRN